jgi:hypothetical protein
MKKFLLIPILLLLFLLFSFSISCKKAEKPASALKPSQSTVPLKSTSPSNWKSIGTFNQGDFYLDFESLTYDGPITTFRYMNVDKEGEVDIARCSINCGEGTIVFKEQQEYDVKRAPSEYKENEKLHWIEIKPDSVWDSFQKSLCKNLARAEKKADEKKLQPRIEKKTKEVSDLKAKLPEKTAVAGSQKKAKWSAPVEEKTVEKQTLPTTEEKKTKEIVRLKLRPPEEKALPSTENKIYYRYSEVTGMPPGAAGGLIQTGKESRAWYEGSKISPPLTDKELLAIENNLAKVEAQNACIIANSIFLNNPDKIITQKDLREKGFFPSEDIELAIYNGARTSLKIAARHNKGTKIYMADRNCNITEETQH